MHIVYFGFDLFADCFNAVVNTKGVKVMALYTFNTDNVFEFNSKVVSIANKHGIPVHYEKITADALKEYFDNGCDLTVSAGYIHKIPILNHKKFKGINIHPALLPIGRGAWPYPCTILKGLSYDGVTVHKITEGFDEGDMLLQKAFKVSKRETLDTLMRKSQRKAKKLIKRTLANFDMLWINAKPQDEGEYWSEPNDTDRTITADMTKEQAKLLVRAFGSYGVIYNGEVFTGTKKGCKRIALKNGELKLHY